MSDVELLSMGDLATRLKRSYSFVRAMRAAGFKTIGGRATLLSALRWLEKCPNPCSRKVSR